MTSYLRPDQEASSHEMEKARGRDKYLKKGIGTALGVASTGGAVGLSSKLIPFLSKYVPIDLAIKGISKVSPKLGDFLKNGMSKGLDLKEGLDFLRTQLGKEEEAAPIISPEKQKETQVKQEAVKKFKVHKEKKEKKQTVFQRETERFSQHYGNSESKAALPQTPGKGQEQILSILQEIRKSRGK